MLHYYHVELVHERLISRNHVLIHLININEHATPPPYSTYAIYMTLDVLMPSEWGFGIVKDLGFVSQMMEIFSTS